MRFFLFLASWLLLTHHAIATPDSTQLHQIIADYEAHHQKKLETAWGSLSDTFFIQQKTFYQAIEQRLQQLQTDSLNAADRINLDLLQFIIKDKIYHLHYESHLMPLNAEGGFLVEIVYKILGRKITTEENLTSYLNELKTLPTYFDRRIELMRRGQQLGKSSPQLVVNNTIQIIENFLKTPVANNFFVSATRHNKTFSPSTQTTVNQFVTPAYQKLLSYLKTEYLPNAPAEIGVANITDGKAFYRQRVRYFTTDDSTPEAVFAIGQSEVKRIRAEMETIIKDLTFTGTFADFLDFLRTDPQFYAQTGEQLLKEAAWITKRMEGKLPQYFGKLPRMPITVAPVDPAIAPTYTTGRYSPGSYQKQRAGTYLVNTYDLPSRPLYVLPALSLHEGVPGHHTQIMLAAEIENVPDFRRNTYLSAFGEGWALYCEYLGEEAGIYETPYERFGRLTYEMWRACRLVVDPGMHYFGWTRQEAFDFMAENTALSFHEVNTEIDRYIGWPGQAVSYKMGELKIRELRKLAEAKLGDRFDLRAFHDLVLANGAVTMGMLEEIVMEWIKKTPAAGGDSSSGQRG